MSKIADQIVCKVSGQERGPPLFRKTAIGYKCALSVGSETGIQVVVGWGVDQSAALADARRRISP